MSYADSPFDESLPLFPHREDVRKYMKGYAEPLRNHTRFGTQIIDVRRNKDNTKWTVRSRPIVAETKGGTVAAGAESQAADVVEEYDAVVIATGNYELPYIPNRAGLTEWHAKYPTSVTNAKNYRNPQQFSNSKGKILVVGNSASANDICYQLATSLGEVVYKLKRSENVMPAGSSPLIKVVADVAKFDAQSKSVHLIDGTVLQDIEKVIFATGYLHSFPFFNQAVTDVPELVTDGKRIYGIYEHTLLYNYPNLAISGAARYILPTRTSESQGSWVAKIWSGKIPQPSKEAMANWETERAAKSDNAVHFHDLFFPEDVHYANRLNEDIVKVNTGLKPFLWSREQISIRGAIRAVKESYIAYKHDTGKLAKSYQELVDSGHLKKFILTDEEMKEHGF